MEGGGLELEGESRAVGVGQVGRERAYMHIQRGQYGWVSWEEEEEDGLDGKGREERGSTRKGGRIGMGTTSSLPSPPLLSDLKPTSF